MTFPFLAHASHYCGNKNHWYWTSSLTLEVTPRSPPFIPKTSGSHRSEPGLMLDCGPGSFRVIWPFHTSEIVEAPMEIGVVTSNSQLNPVATDIYNSVADIHYVNYGYLQLNCRYSSLRSTIWFRLVKIPVQDIFNSPLDIYMSLFRYLKLSFY